jgi:hypothetical protein
MPPFILHGATLHRVVPESFYEACGRCLPPKVLAAFLDHAYPLLPPIVDLKVGIDLGMSGARASMIIFDDIE